MAPSFANSSAEERPILATGQVPIAQVAGLEKVKSLLNFVNKLFIVLPILAVLLLAALFWLLRTQRLREKYSVLWFAVIVGVVLLTFVPAITGWLTGLVGVTTPINLVFILAFLVLLVVCIQLSIEISNLEEETRTVAEELALLRETSAHLAGLHGERHRLACQR